MKTLAILAVITVATPASSIDLPEAAGLDLRVESIGEVIEVDGMPLHIQRATGPNVPDLAGRIIARWQAEGALVRSERQGDWQVRSRWINGDAELIQWRGKGATAELLQSRLDLRQPARPQAAPFGLPTSCAWGRSIRGNSAAGRYHQQSAYCRASGPGLMASLRTSLTAAGWQVRADSVATLSAQRELQDATLWVAPGSGSRDSWIIWVARTSQP